ELLEGRNMGNDFTLKDGWRMYHGQTIPGFPYHPHRGFETITIVNKGICDHSDSLGAAGRFGHGDVQWMTAGSGVQHSEMFPLLNQEKENPLELFQIWLNLPAKDKFVDPHFKMLWHEDIPIVEEPNATIKVIAGDYHNTKAPKPAPNTWAATPDNHVNIWNISVKEGSEFNLPASEEGLNRVFYFYEGDFVHFGERKVNVNFGIALQSHLAATLTVGNKPAHFLLLEGKPISEPVAKYGPFVMNTEAEIHKTMEEYQLTEFGGWPWPYPDNVHEANKGRFALYPDGTLEEKT
ncbi:MAG: pirin family protein, partial [Bacteroidota bacterium]